MDEFTLSLISILSLTALASIVFVITKRFSFPYTVGLVILGVLIALLSKYLPQISFLKHFELSPAILFYIFLPTLLFEAGYNIKLNRLVENLKPISSLAILGLLISSFFIASVLKYLALLIFDINIPLYVSLLFGAIISATDPVAVIALFKEYGAPKRLTLIFEGESLFNDGTAVALFFVILSLIESGNKNIIEAGLLGLLSFSSMITLGILYGIFSGYIFSKALSLAKSNNFHITLMLLLAHISFLSSELINKFFEDLGLHLSISAIIATAVASITMGNYGKHKLSPKLQKYINTFWDYAAFLANSLVFVLLGFLIEKVWGNFISIYPLVILAILVVVIARFVSVYLSLGIIKDKEEQVPQSWKILLGWASLRGALAITMALLLPDNLSIARWPFEISVKDFILTLLVFSMYFTLFIKALTVKPLMRHLKIDRFSKLEEIENTEAHSIVTAALVNYLKKLKEEGRISKSLFEKIKEELKRQEKAYKAKSEEADENESGKDLETSMRYYSLGIEKMTVEELFSKSEITDKVFRKYLSKIEKLKRQLICERGLDFALDEELSRHSKGLEKFLNFFSMGKDFSLNEEEQVMYYRAMRIAAQEVINEFEKLRNLDAFKSDKWQKSIERVKNNYKKLLDYSKGKLKRIFAQRPELMNTEEKIIRATLKKEQEKILEELLYKNLITENIMKNYN